MSEQPKKEHPITKMDDIARLEMELEWQALVEEMNLTKVLGQQGFEFSKKMFIEAYSRAFGKLKNL
jgi:hypothetical protein